MNELQQEFVFKLMCLSVFYFVVSIGFLLWDYFRWVFK